MKRLFINIFTIKTLFILPVVTIILCVSCNDLLNQPAENKTFAGNVDYTLSENMISPIIGLYKEFYDQWWECYPLVAVRGDDVNAGGLGDQPGFWDTDQFKYDKDYWMYNSVWEGYYSKVFFAFAAIDQINLYKENGANPALAEQYIAEAQTIRAYMLFLISRLWGNVFIPEDLNPANLEYLQLSSKDDVMKYISDQMDEAIPKLPDMHPATRTDIPGGVSKYTAYAIKALANLELKNYPAVAEATSRIISSRVFELEPDFYQLFKLKGKLNKENLLEWQYANIGLSAEKNYLWAFFGPQNWIPKANGIGGGWGFYEPSLKWIKFMLNRNEIIRLQTSVLFTDRGIDELKKYTGLATLPSWISNTTPSGDIVTDYARALFASGKQYLPSDQCTPGITDYGCNKNFTCIRYAEVLLMHAEALTQGATSSALTADQAVNLVRNRAGLGNLSGVTHDQVIDEKFAELAMEWGTRYYDLIRLGKFTELNYDGRTFQQNLSFLPYPQNQVDLLPSLKAAISE